MGAEVAVSDDPVVALCEEQMGFAGSPLDTLARALLVAWDALRECAPRCQAAQEAVVCVLNIVEGRGDA